MPDRPVPAFSSAVLQYIKSIGDGTLQLDAMQLAELPSDLAKDLGEQEEYVSGATTMGKLLGKRVQAAPSKVELKRLLEYFAQGLLDAEAPLLDNALDAPLSNYFINSSHNTYLTGNQLYGAASTEAYKDVLRRGCRSIEVDVWDGKTASSGKGPNPRTNSGDSVGDLNEQLSEKLRLEYEPRVLHGHTLTKEVAFRDVCKAIGETAFETSDLPIVVSLEVHAGAEQQEKMVQIMRQTWQHMLVEPPSDECTSLPKPSDLRRKILVKVKGKALGKPEDALAALSRTETEESLSSSDEERAKTDKKAKLKPSKIIEGLSALGIYTQAYHFKALDSPEASMATHVFSLSERKVMTVHENQAEKLFEHNRRFMMRAFPLGTRVTSTNLDPGIYWRKGIQMVALNWQKFDAGIMQNHAMFSGSDGWVLKPEGYRSPDDVSHTASSSSALNITAKRYDLDLSVEILAAQQLPPAKHPYVKGQLHIETLQEKRGERLDRSDRNKEDEYKQHSKVTKTLDFKQEVLKFPSARDIVPALSFVRFKIMDDVLGPDELVAWGCVRLDRLRAGIRFLHLFDAHGRSTDGVLLLKITTRLVDSVHATK